MKRGWKIGACIILGALFVVLFGYITMYLWNWLVPVLFSGPVINIWQAFGLLILSKILFSGKGHWHRGKCGHGSHGYGSYWKHRLHEKFSSMTEEEREAFKKKMKDKWCRFQDDTSTGKSDSSNG